jgi:chromosomal replication initiation ATPase DnaA
VSAPQQLSLPLPIRHASGREDYFVTDANAVAVATVEDWHDWPGRRCVLTGPQGAGKTHLTHVWAALSGAQVLPADKLATADIAELATGPVAIEDADRIAGDRAAEAALFHLYNLAQAEGGALLLTARSAPTRWPLALPDLASRLAACQTVALSDPDDALLGALLVKLFADHGIVPRADVVPFLVARIPRRYSAAQAIVAALDVQAMERRTDVNRPLASRVLAAFDAQTHDGAS